jgi:hypothetical protein
LEEDEGRAEPQLRPDDEGPQRGTSGKVGKSMAKSKPKKLATTR